MRLKYVLGVVGLILIVLVSIGPIMSQVEQPKYTVIEQHDDIEIRQYAPMLVAQVRVTGDKNSATGDGFRLLADYIFGNNSLYPNAKPALQNSSTQEKTPKENKIAMTAPVTQQAVELAIDGAENTSEYTPKNILSINNEWHVSFVMPAQYTLDNIPKPNNQKVTLHKKPAKRMAVIRFSGQKSNELLTEKEGKLRAFLNKQNLTSVGAPLYAFYNPPWTLPIMRRNEVMLEIK